jgi:hypothetical protein
MNQFNEYRIYNDDKDNKKAQKLGYDLDLLDNYIDSVLVRVGKGMELMGSPVFSRFLRDGAPIGGKIPARAK